MKAWLVREFPAHRPTCLGATRSMHLSQVRAKSRSAWRRSLAEGSREQNLHFPHPFGTR